MGHGKEVTGKIILDLSEELSDSELNDEQTENLMNVVKKFWDSYIQMDKENYLKHCAKDIRKMSQRNRSLLDGVAKISDSLQKEWEAFERPDNLLSEEMTLREISIWADDKSNPTVAIVYYWIEINGGVRWIYDDQGLVLQVFNNENGSWKLVHHTDGWSTDYDLDEEDYGEEPTFVFDYVYPVNDLNRAIDFYTPILGKPDFVSDTKAIFGLSDPGFILDASGLYGHSEVKKGLTNGYAVLYVENLKKGNLLSCYS